MRHPSHFTFHCITMQCTASLHRRLADEVAVLKAAAWYRAGLQGVVAPHPLLPAHDTHVWTHALRSGLVGQRRDHLVLAHSFGLSQRIIGGLDQVQVIPAGWERRYTYAHGYR